MVNLESERSFESANVRFSYDESALGETAHFSRFAVFDVRNWGENFFAHRPEDGADEDEIEPLDVVFDIDSSGSMSSNDPSGFREQAATEFDLAAQYKPDHYWWRHPEQVLEGS